MNRPKPALALVADDPASKVLVEAAERERQEGAHADRLRDLIQRRDGLAKLLANCEADITATGRAWWDMRGLRGTPRIEGLRQELGL